MTRERPVTYVDVTAELGPSPGYAYAARAEGAATLFTAGAVPVDRDGRVIGDDVREQTLAVIANLVTALEAGGATPADVVKTTIYVATTDHDELVAAWDVFSEHELSRAPSTLVGVTLLGYTGQLVEIEAVAAIR